MGFLMGVNLPVVHFISVLTLQTQNLAIHYYGDASLLITSPQRLFPLVYMG